MCKIFAVAGLATAEQRQNAWELLKLATPYLSERDHDGFGYAAYNAKDGVLFGEKWLDPKDAWVCRGKYVRPGFEDALLTQSKYDSFGERKKAAYDRTTAIIAHARMSTNNVCLENVHPFFAQMADGAQLALIHNGMVHGFGKHALDTTGSKGCDSAGILNEYIAAKVHYDPAAIQETVDKLGGYYACAVIAAPGQDRGDGFVDIFRGSEQAELWSMEIDEIGQVFCTSDEIILRCARALKMSVGGKWRVASKKLIRIDANTGGRITIVPFDPPSYGSGHYAGHWEREEYCGVASKPGGPQGFLGDGRPKDAGAAPTTKWADKVAAEAKKHGCRLVEDDGESVWLKELIAVKKAAKALSEKVDMLGYSEWGNDGA